MILNSKLHFPVDLDSYTSVNMPYMFLILVYYYICFTHIAMITNIPAVLPDPSLNTVANYLLEPAEGRWHETQYLQSCVPDWCHSC